MRELVAAGRAREALLLSIRCCLVLFHLCLLLLAIIPLCFLLLSSTRAKRVGPKGLRAESATAFTGRLCPHSGKGADFLSRQPNFFTETALTPERKVEKLFPRSEINRHAEG